MAADKAKEFLIDWIKGYLKNRDVMAKNIESIGKSKEGFDVYVKFKDKEQFIIALPNIENIEGILSKLENKEGYYTIVTFNSGKNFKGLISNWSKFAEFKFLNIFFVNPFSELDKRWIIYPHTHNKICDKDSLEKGLKSMFEMVEPISEEDIKKNF
ncbi:hypothetical protein KY360_02370 [Candidatus Woesearchaeota archaeon]|nr:hypothetical protein [Candidatus Woesearchaeota archaeon]